MIIIIVYIFIYMYVIMFNLAWNYYNKLWNQSSNCRLEKLVIYDCLLAEKEDKMKEMQTIIKVEVWSMSKNLFLILVLVISMGFAI